MEENSRPASPDLAAAESCGNRLTRATSVSSSSTLSVDSWKDFADRSASIRSCTTWTNEKHNLYLGALEASFVKQLHQSRGLLPWHLEQNTHDSSLYLQQPVDASYSSDQFTVLRDGSWQKINFETNQKVTSSRLFGRPHVSLPCSEADFHLVTESPWIHHCRCSGKHGTIISTDMLECSVSHNETVPLRGKRIFTHRLMCSEHKCACHKLRQDTVGSVAVAFHLIFSAYLPSWECTRRAILNNTVSHFIRFFNVVCTIMPIDIVLRRHHYVICT
ncbi:uncharacterized protein LOC127801550 isoform X2 [Diospyros lotus]|uniref:uncharacterized protein LOC127801550 isoform X2 n=1 Tax=Diospyros lotus TaxID=55363 RepID=UPI002258E0FC|nr:uncharacterized protein LOC127801550 isoform X2 [Diospyros lotus]